jgi:hypothetical protein
MIKHKPFLAFLTTCIVVAGIVSCKKDEPDTTDPTPDPTPTACAPQTSHAITGTGPHLIFKFKFDSTQARLNNLGQPASIPAGRAGQSPQFRSISQHYIELANDWNPLGAGQILYVGAETTAGGAQAIDHCSSTITGQEEVFFSKPISQITPGSYKWLRVSLAYQNYDIVFKSNALPWQIDTGNVASFVGFRTYIREFNMNGQTVSPSASAGGVGNHSQGYWAFRTDILGNPYFADGQAPSGATTVPNPFNASPIPSGSCVVTGEFVGTAGTNAPLIITGNETQDIVITVSLSTNKSFEWTEVVQDGYYQPEIGEGVVDMGLRGLIPFIQ